MNEIEREKPLTTADLAAAARREEKPRRVETGGEEITEEVPIRGEKEPVPEGERLADRRPARRETESAEPLFATEEAHRLREEWDSIQIAFVDEPRASVKRADRLVAQAIQRLAEVFSAERGALEKQWDRGDEVSTEDLRLVLQRYRSFFGRLLSV